jgi:hypothetical protein
MPWFNKIMFQSHLANDIIVLQSILKKIKEIFIEKGVRSLKKQMLSSKEKEVWTCSCSKVNDIDSLCHECSHDINGFLKFEVSSKEAILNIEEKISLISESLL